MKSCHFHRKARSLSEKIGERADLFLSGRLRSLFLHFECGVLLQKNSQVAVLRDDVRATLPQCREIQVTECRTSLPGTVLDSVLRLLSPLM